MKYSPFTPSLAALTMKTHVIIIATFMVLLSGCQKSKEDNFAHKRDLSEYEKTDFAPTLESPIVKGQNSVYCSTLLLAWDRVRTELNGGFIVDSIDHDLFLFNKSRSYLKSLTKDEYTSKVHIHDLKIKVEVFFSKTLPFVEDFEDQGNALTFENNNVKSFGGHGVKMLYEILYYKNDSDFVIKLLTKDQSNELILYKSDMVFHTMTDAIQSANLKIQQGIKDRIDDRFCGNYSFNKDDKLLIPKLDFNIETNYPKMENKVVYNNNEEWIVENIYQRTAFKLNEKGAKVESEAKVEMCCTTVVGKVASKPKNLIFDKPFFVILRKSTSENPYFAMWICNDELMIKQ